MSDKIFNSPFELGVRMVFLLQSLHPGKVDLQRLVYLDYASIYSADLGGPPSLHTPVPLRGGEYISRREIIEEGLYLMAARSFVDVDATGSGIVYSLGENGASLTGLLGNEYSRSLLNCCEWTSSRFGSLTDKELETVFDKHGLLWGAHFVSSELRASV